MNGKDFEDNTPLHFAVSRNFRVGLMTTQSANTFSEIICALPAAGADPLAPNNDRETPWDVLQEDETLLGTDAYRAHERFPVQRRSIWWWAFFHTHSRAGRAKAVRAPARSRYRVYSTTTDRPRNVELLNRRSENPVYSLSDGDRHSWRRGNTATGVSARGFGGLDTLSDHPSHRNDRRFWQRGRVGLHSRSTHRSVQHCGRHIVVWPRLVALTRSGFRCRVAWLPESIAEGGVARSGLFQPLPSSAGLRLSLDLRLCTSTRDANFVTLVKVKKSEKHSQSSQLSLRSLESQKDGSATYGY